MDSNRNTIAGALDPASSGGSTPVWRRGFVLVTVLWAIVLLSAIAASFAKSAWTESRIVRNMSHSAEAESLADGGIYRGILELLQASGDTPWRVDGTPYSVEEPNGTIIVSLQDESGKIDLNRGPEEMLENLFRISGLDDDDARSLATRVVDFRDLDDDTRAGGSETEAYRAAGRNDGPKNRDFEVVDELLRVPGITLEFFQRIRPFVTIHSNAVAFNPNTAPREVLLSRPGADPQLVDEALAGRSQPDDLGAGSTAFRSRSGGPATAALDPVFTIRADATTDRGARFVREAVVAVATQNAKPYRILTWARHFLPDSVD